MSVMTATDHRIPNSVADMLVLPAAYADNRIHDTYRWLRTNEPLGVADVEGVDPFWVVTRHADILEISRQNDLFHNGDRSPTLTSQAVDAKVRAMIPTTARVESLNAGIAGSVALFECMRQRGAGKGRK